MLKIQSLFLLFICFNLFYILTFSRTCEAEQNVQLRTTNCKITYQICTQSSVLSTQINQCVKKNSTCSSGYFGSCNETQLMENITDPIQCLQKCCGLSESLASSLGDNVIQECSIIDSQAAETSIGIIIGAILGALAGIIILALLFKLCLSKILKGMRYKQSKQQNSQENSSKNKHKIKNKIQTFKTQEKISNQVTVANLIWKQETRSKQERSQSTIAKSQCFVCHELQSNSETFCHHEFHATCLNQFLKSNANCPQCDCENIFPVVMICPKCKDSNCKLNEKDFFKLALNFEKNKVQCNNCSQKNDTN